MVARKGNTIITSQKAALGHGQLCAIACHTGQEVHSDADDDDDEDNNMLTGLADRTLQLNRFSATLRLRDFNQRRLNSVHLMQGMMIDSGVLQL